MERHLVHNSITCLNCGEVIVSRHRHDFQRCNCPNGTFIDGGLEPFGRFGGKDLNMIKQFQVTSDDDHSLIRTHFERGTYGKNGDEPLRYVPLKDIDDDWLDNIIKYEEQYRPDNKYLNHYRDEKEYRAII